MFNSQYYTCEQVDERLLQGYVDDFNEVNSTNYSKEDLLLKLFQSINWDQVFGKYEENPEFVRLYLDVNRKVLWGIRANGDIYYGAGVPSQIRYYIDSKIRELHLDKVDDILIFLDDLLDSDKTLKELLEELDIKKVDKEEGKSLIDAYFASGITYIESPEFIDVLLDSVDKILEGHKKNGNKYFNTPVEFGSKVENDSAEVRSENNPEGFIEVTTDGNDKIINSIDKELEDIHYGGINISEIKRDLDNETLLTDCDEDGIIYTVENNDSTITLEVDDDLNLYEIKDSHQTAEIIMEEETGDIYLEQTLKDM